MRQGKRFGLSTVQKSELWRRWKAGQSLHEIGRAFGKEHSSIRCLVSQILGWSASTAVRMAKRYGHIRPEVQRQALVAVATQADVNQIVHQVEGAIEFKVPN